MTSSGLSPGPDGRPRCGWCVGAPDYLACHDDEWGRPLRGDTELFESMMLEAFQSGLSWLTILRKRENFRGAFEGFEIDKVAGYGARKKKRLMADAGILRTRAKIEATIANAKATRELQAGGETLTDLLWGFRPARAREGAAQAQRPRAHAGCAFVDVTAR